MKKIIGTFSGKIGNLLTKLNEENIKNGEKIVDYFLMLDKLCKIAALKGKNKSLESLLIKQKVFETLSGFRDAPAADGKFLPVC